MCSAIGCVYSRGHSRATGVRMGNRWVGSRCKLCGMIRGESGGSVV